MKNKYKIILTKHAKTRMRERGVRVENIRKAVSAPTSIIPSFDETLQFRKKIGKRVLEVVCVIKRAHAIIITAYYL
jgi:hypothetical protein